MSVVILEGPDQCGKTNIGRELSRRTGISYFKNKDEHKYFLSDPKYFIHAIKYVDSYFTSYLEASGASVILDRAWPSEFVYSEVLKRQTDYSVLRELDLRHAALGTTIVIAHRSDYSKVVDTYDVVNKNIQRIHDLYMEFAEWSKCRVLLLNVDDEDLDREVGEIASFAGLTIIPDTIPSPPEEGRNNP